ncbi:MAG TPA: VWA domain-containing protein [Bryobacteraceae bacterium]|nr:VWA domain-containing protein [Bryobacteraceae bacterium]
MLRKLAVAILAICAVGGSQERMTETADLNLRVAVDLVQVDAVVTDSRGRHVAGLSSADFELLLDGKPQALKVFDFVNVEKGGVASTVHPDGVGKSDVVPSVREASIKPADVRRTVVLFVDDLSLSADRVPLVRKALHDLVDKQMQPGDLVAIVRASAGLGALRDFTTDKNLLHAAADQVRWNSTGKAGMSAFGSGCCDSDHSTSTGEEESRFRAEHFAALTVESLKRLVAGMATLPGRKSVIILASEFPMSLPEYDNGLGMNTFNGAGSPEPLGLMAERMLRLADAATRASVVFYAIDTKLLATQTDLDAIKPSLGQLTDNQALPAGGTNNPALSPGGYGIPDGHATSAGRSPSPMPDPQLGNSDYKFERGGGMFLSSQTGGFMLSDTNDIGYAIEEVLSDSNSYYLLGFAPPEEAFQRYPGGKPRFHRITIKVNKPGLRVRSRSGFFGELDAGGTGPAAAGGELLAALDSPFRSDGVGVDVKCAFLKAGRNLPSVRVSMIVRGQDLSLEGPVYNRSAIIHLLVRAYSVNGADLDTGVDKTLRVSLNEEGFQRALKFGLVYATEIEVAKPGPYRLRVALQDEASGRIGSASQFVVVPNLNGRKLALSGLIFPGSYGTSDDIVPAPSPIALVPGSSANFVFEIFGAGDRSRSLQSQVRLFRDGAKVYEGPVGPLQVASKRVHGEIFAKEELRIPPELPPGDYALQEEVTEQNTRGKIDRALQWADLHIGVAN